MAAEEEASKGSEETIFPPFPQYVDRAVTSELDHKFLVYRGFAQSERKRKQDKKSAKISYIDLALAGKSWVRKEIHRNQYKYGERERSVAITVENQEILEREKADFRDNKHLGSNFSSPQPFRFYHVEGRGSNMDWVLTEEEQEKLEQLIAKTVQHFDRAPLKAKKRDTIKTQKEKMAKCPTRRAGLSDMLPPHLRALVKDTKERAIAHKIVHHHLNKIERSIEEVNLARAVIKNRLNQLSQFYRFDIDFTENLEEYFYSRLGFASTEEVIKELNALGKSESITSLREKEI